MPSAALIDRACDVNAANLALGHEAFDVPGARFVRDPRIPDIHDANHVTAITAATPREIEALFERAEREFAGFGQRIFHAGHRTPPAFEARLRLEGYERTDALVMLLEGPLRGEPQPCDIRPVTSDADWDALVAMSDLDWAEYETRKERSEGASVGRHMAMAKRWKCPPVRYFMAYAEGEPRGYFNAWEGIDGVGQVEDLFVHPDWRHRGIATALIHRCVADARAHGAGPVVIVADPTDTPKHMYAAMGWVPVAVKRAYRRTAP